MKEYRPFVIAAIAVVLLTVGYTAFMIFAFMNLEQSGQFGDMFGGLNAIFSGLAFSGRLLLTR